MRYNHFIEWVSLGGCPECEGPTVTVAHFLYTSMTLLKDEMRIQSVHDMDVLEY
jgi:hypothetical protein